jgi:hypothetical protein
MGLVGSKEVRKERTRTENRKLARKEDIDVAGRRIGKWHRENT